MKIPAFTITLALVGGTIGAAATPPGAAAPVLSRLAILTFNQTNASASPVCQIMIQTANGIEAAPYTARYVAHVLAVDAAGCLRDVRYETDDPVAAEVPLAVLKAAQAIERRYAPR